MESGTRQIHRIFRSWEPNFFLLSAGVFRTVVVYYIRMLYGRCGREAARPGKEG